MSKTFMTSHTAFGPNAAPSGRWNIYRAHFERNGLRLHPDKTGLLTFRRPDRKNDEDNDKRGPRTFDLPGLSHVWGRSRRGKWVVKKRTATNRFSRSLHRLRQWCRQNRHAPVAEQHLTLRRKLRGHCAYHGVTGNIRSQQRYYWLAVQAWRKWLSRRSRASRYKCTWKWMRRLLLHIALPPPRIVHRWGSQLKLSES